MVSVRHNIAARHSARISSLLKFSKMMPLADVQDFSTLVKSRTCTRVRLVATRPKGNPLGGAPHALAHHFFNRLLAGTSVAPPTATPLRNKSSTASATYSWHTSLTWDWDCAFMISAANTCISRTRMQADGRGETADQRHAAAYWCRKGVEARTAPAISRQNRLPTIAVSGGRQKNSTKTTACSGVLENVGFRRQFCRGYPP